MLQNFGYLTGATVLFIVALIGCIRVSDLKYDRYALILLFLGSLAFTTATGSLNEHVWEPVIHLPLWQVGPRVLGVEDYLFGMGLSFNGFWVFQSWRECNYELYCRERVTLPSLTLLSILIVGGLSATIAGAHALGLDTILVAVISLIAVSGIIALLKVDREASLAEHLMNSDDLLMTSLLSCIALFVFFALIFNNSTMGNWWVRKEATLLSVPIVSVLLFSLGGFLIGGTLPLITHRMK